ncbi:PEP-CTERM sorting domain-containing protein [Okeania hirsuta]|uniref:PEP-CTERM sorting domain-containing protein n=1 Tax=Okeania hirsuta TaxID=1458930 RepID=A0A3N6PNQ7_9CYAN|nr:PEP-CTERM sorting domain-containing protein [Okeania hirsuta]RQH33447.1 PEP-CTERM sorting domain-containing protein [Okeania hirsuta]
MLKKLSIAAAGSAIATLTAVSGANAASFSYTGSGGAFPPTFTSSITVTDDIAIDDLSLDLNNFQHTWAGDVVATLSFDDGFGSVISTVMSNPLGGVDSGNFDFNGDYTFADGGIALPRINPLPEGTYAPEDSFIDIFGGLNAKGTWTLELLDALPAFDDGSLGSWDLNIEGDPVSTPEPASLLGLFGIGVLGATSLKRKQKEKV